MLKNRYATCLILMSCMTTAAVATYFSPAAASAAPQVFTVTQVVLAREDHSPLTSVSLAHVSHGKIVVIGGIAPCIGAAPVNGDPRGPRYAAGTVTVLRGKLTWKSLGRGNRTMIFPTHVVGRASVGENRTYRFVLVPGQYVLRARLLHSNVASFAQVILKRGTVVHVDIPNMCI